MTATIAENNNQQHHNLNKEAMNAPVSSSGLALLSSGQKPLTAFQQKVLRALCEVPTGRVTTYKLLAAHVGCGSSQAVGQALKRNPYAPTVPCHRVVAHNGSIGGFGGCTSGAKIDAKMELLRGEGVFVDENGWVEQEYIYNFEDKEECA